CHRPGLMTNDRRAVADKMLRRFLRAAVPWRWGWLKWCYWAGVHVLGGYKAWDSCGPAAGELCRHNMEMPEWMADLQKE
ncbi:unnamed protein product, partial [marine sediment metagenome]